MTTLYTMGRSRLPKCVRSRLNPDSYNLCHMSDKREVLSLQGEMFFYPYHCKSFPIGAMTKKFRNLHPSLLRSLVLSNRLPLSYFKKKMTSGIHFGQFLIHHKYLTHKSHDPVVFHKLKNYHDHDRTHGTDTDSVQFPTTTETFVSGHLSFVENAVKKMCCLLCEMFQPDSFLLSVNRIRDSYTCLPSTKRPVTLVCKHCDVRSLDKDLSEYADKQTPDRIHISPRCKLRRDLCLITLHMRGSLPLKTYFPQNLNPQRKYQRVL